MSLEKTDGTKSRYDYEECDREGKRKYRVQMIHTDKIFGKEYIGL